jgi:hypothetical protein
MTVNCAPEKPDKSSAALTWHDSMNSICLAKAMNRLIPGKYRG